MLSGVPGGPRVGEQARHERRLPPAALYASPEKSTAISASAEEENGTFGFPYAPYAPQRQFMATLWGALEGGGPQGTKFAALEMPTGGGKSLALLCPSVLWLKRNEEELLLQQLRQRSAAGGAVAGASAAPPSKTAPPPWIKKALQQQQRQEVGQFLVDREERLRQAAERAVAGASAAARRSQNPPEEDDDEDSFAPEERGASAEGQATHLGCADAFQASPEAFSRGKAEKPQERLRKPQVLICTRTHQQLQQYVGEVRLLQLHAKQTELKRFVAVVAAGRQQLCIHPDVCGAAGAAATAHTPAASSADMGDKCAYLVSRGLCSFYKQREKVVDAALAAPLDIEDLRRTGVCVGGCPYYACRHAAAHADVVLMPFSLAFPPPGETVETLPLSLVDSVLCVDEAHHLADALASSKAATLTHRSAHAASLLLHLYIQQYMQRLSPRSHHLLQQLKRLAEHLVKGLNSFCCCCKVVLTPTAFLRLFKLEGFDFHELIAFLSDGRRAICQKTRGFASHRNHKRQQEEIQHQREMLEASCIYHLKSLLCALLGMDPADRILIRNDHRPGGSRGAAKACQDRRGGSHAASASVAATSQVPAPEVATPGATTCCCCKVEVVCVAAEKAFEPILNASRLVVVMGGTLSPFASLLRFTRSLAPSQSVFFSANPVASKNRVLGLVISKVADSPPFCFEYMQRHALSLQFVGLLRLLHDASAAVRGGVVVFFPSFAVLQSFLAFAIAATSPPAGIAREALAAAGPLIAELKKRGRFFAEKRSPTPSTTEGGTLLLASGLLSAGICMAHGGTLWHLYKMAVSGGGAAEGGNDGGKRRRRVEELGGSCTISLGASKDSLGQGDPFESSPSQPQTTFLFCVMGGRFSEGVNFADALARLVVIVGLPFPSIKDTVFTLHRQHYEDLMLQQRQQGAAGGGRAASGSDTDAAQMQASPQQQNVDYALLQCMITVNQTIGRAIRHSKDFAAILLVDRRYDEPRIQRLLPRWLLESLERTVPPLGLQGTSQHGLFAGATRQQEEEGDVIAQRLRRFFEALEKGAE
ncbi:ATP-dependent DNA helicase chl1 [Cyclospora cayetanensis]|uniref:ATP-dependent DNA helicase chl1 n=1 Tax=Cyclospora cayetanensis TaxID=88456 RepID=A0A6P6RY36_9EIME|nr:ATP-dependent DNA helicase chl1 [Cyclospora cayetanensis]